jgi:hypothetical protein
MPLDINDYREMERQRREFSEPAPGFLMYDKQPKSFGNFCWRLGYESYEQAMLRYFIDARQQQFHHDLKKKVMTHVDQVLEARHPLGQIEVLVRPRTEQEQQQGYSSMLDIKIWPPFPIGWTPPEDETA